MFSTNRTFGSQRVLTLIAGLGLTSLVVMPAVCVAIGSNGGNPDMSGFLGESNGTNPDNSSFINPNSSLGLLLLDVSSEISGSTLGSFKNDPIPCNGLGPVALDALEQFTAEVPGTSRLAQGTGAYTRVAALVSPLLAEADTHVNVSQSQVRHVREAAADTVNSGNDVNGKLKAMVNKDNLVVVSAVNPAIRANAELKHSVNNLIDQVGTLPNNGSRRQRVALATLYAAIDDIVQSEEVITPELHKISDLTHKGG